MVNSSVIPVFSSHPFIPLCIVANAPVIVAITFTFRAFSIVLTHKIAQLVEAGRNNILIHNTELLAPIVIKIWENWSSASEEVETVADSRSKHGFSAKRRGWGGWVVPPSSLALIRDWAGGECSTSIIIAPWDSESRASAYPFDILALRFDFEYWE